MKAKLKSLGKNVVLLTTLLGIYIYDRIESKVTRG